MSRTTRVLLLCAVLSALGVLIYRTAPPTLSAPLTGADKSQEDSRDSKKSLSSGSTRPGLSQAVGPASAVEMPIPPSFNLSVEKALSAGTIDAIEALDVGASPTSKLDRGELLRQAKLICNALPTLSKKGLGSFVALVRDTIPHRELSPVQIRSGELVDDFRTRFCTRGVDIEEQNFTGYEEMVADLEAVGMQAIVDGLSIGEDAAQAEVLAVRDALVELLSTTDSPTGFLLAAQRFSEDGPVAYAFPAGGFDARGANLSHPLAYRPAGTTLAYCRMAPSACAPGGLMTMSICMPSNCMPNESLFMYYTRTQSPQVMEAANRYAQMLLALRRGG